MKRFYLFLLIISFLSVSFADARPKVIFDTDIDSDVDDVGALAMLLNMHAANEIDLIGIIVTSDDPYAPLCVRSICRFYGFPEIPVGFLTGQERLVNHSRYTRQISEAYPSGLKDISQLEDGTALYRRLLSRCGRNSVKIITVGHLSSLMRLLQSGPDEHSRLSGKALAGRKVHEWICMGGQYPSGKEANFYRPDPVSTSYCLDNWDGSVTFCGWEIGNLIMTGGTRVKEGLPESHPVHMAYRLYNGFASRQSWDQLAVYMLRPDAGRFIEKVTDGKCEVNELGENIWVKDKPGSHSYIRLKDPGYAEALSEEIDSMMMGK